MKLLERVLDPVRTLQLLQFKLYERSHPDEPWIAPEAVRYCENILTKDMHGIEWGSGRSTSWFAERLGRLHSIEHDRTWYEAVRHSIPDNVQYELIELDHPTKEPCKKTYDKTPNYVSAIDKDERIDFAVVDGHYRQACVYAAVRKLYTGGYLLIDNTDWLPMKDWGVPDSFDLVCRAKYVGETCIWRKMR